jgi:tRNA(adenine34) deaminase
MNIKYMYAALSEAKKAERAGEVPIGAIIVKDNKIIGRGYNKREKKQLATAHAEIFAINQACRKLNSWRLDDCDMYVTLEPCLMCLGAIINARIKNVYFGSFDDKREDKPSGIFNLAVDNGLNHNIKTEGGILEEECKKIVKNFFIKKRAQK